VYHRRQQPISQAQQGSTFDSQLDTKAISPLIPAPSNPDPVSSNLDDLDMPISLRKRVRRCTQHPLAHYISYHRLSQTHKSFLTSLNTIVIPKSVDEALKDHKWKLAMQEEMKALEKNNTWDLVPRPKGVGLVGCIWVFNLKYNVDGTLRGTRLI